MTRRQRQATMALLCCLAAAGAKAADDLRLECSKADTDTALDFSSLNLYLSAGVPPGTVLYSGNMNIALRCRLNDPQRYGDRAAELYFKRKQIESGELGYGLTLYTGYGGSLGTNVETIATGKRVGACANGEAESFCNTVTLSVPFQIVKTSTSMTEPAAREKLNIFDIGSEAAGTDLKFYAVNTHAGITVRDETCSTVGMNNLTVTLGSHSLSRHGLGAGMGATGTTTAFALTLNCEALLSGSFDVMMQFNGTPVPGFADKGVFALTENSRAANVGVQLLNGDKEPVVSGTPFSVASFPLSSPMIKVPFYARYYQTGEKITAGTANSLVTWTISYQ